MKAQPVIAFPPTARVRQQAAYTRIFAQGTRKADPLLALHVLPRNVADTIAGARLGLAVSRKVSALAVQRNRIKRTLRDEFRHLRAQLPAWDCVVVARPPAATASGEALRASFRQLLQRSGALPAQAGTGTMPTPHPTPPAA